MDVKSKGLLRRVFDRALAEISRRALGETGDDASTEAQCEAHATEVLSGEEASPPQAQVAVPAPQPEHGPSAHSSVVFVRGEAGHLRVRWRISAEHVSRAAALVPEPHVPCLRLIAYASSSSAVEREIQDRPNAPADGECDVRDVPERMIASFGLRAGDKFVSVAHAVL
jgi:hypothetical protein